MIRQLRKWTIFEIVWWSISSVKPAVAKRISSCPVLGVTMVTTNPVTYPAQLKRTSILSIAPIHASMSSLEHTSKRRVVTPGHNIANNMERDGINKAKQQWKVNKTRRINTPCQSHTHTQTHTPCQSHTHTQTHRHTHTHTPHTHTDTHTHTHTHTHTPPHTHPHTPC